MERARGGELGSTAGWAGGGRSWEIRCGGAGASRRGSRAWVRLSFLAGLVRAASVEMFLAHQLGMGARCGICSVLALLTDAD